MFCLNPLEPNKADPDFEEEYLAGEANGFSCLFFDYDALVSDGSISIAIKRIKQSSTIVPIIYRGWMLTPQQYKALYDALLAKNYCMVNTPEAYQNCHYLPDSLKFIAAQTPKTVFEPYDGSGSIERLLAKVKEFGSAPVIIKDYVKSEKHDWATACFVPDASDTLQLRVTINNFLQLRDKFLNVGIVVREFTKLKELTTHSKSGMPLMEEYRLFFLRGKLIGIYNYWEEGDYDLAVIDPAEFEALAQTIESSFFSMDIARLAGGGFVIIELGDGQVSGLPDRMDKSDFYRELGILAAFN